MYARREKLVDGLADYNTQEECNGEKIRLVFPRLLKKSSVTASANLPHLQPTCKTHPVSQSVGRGWIINWISQILPTAIYRILLNQALCYLPLATRLDDFIFFAIQ